MSAAVQSTSCRYSVELDCTSGQSGIALGIAIKLSLGRMTLIVFTTYFLPSLALRLSSSLASSS